MNKFTVLACALVLSACGTTSSVTKNDLARPIESNNARIIIERDTSMLYFGSGATVRINGERIGSLARGSSLMHDVRSGKTLIEVSASTAFGQHVFSFDAKRGRTYEFIISPKGSALATGAAWGIVGDAAHGATSDNSGYFQVQSKGDHK